MVDGIKTQRDRPDAVAPEVHVAYAGSYLGAITVADALRPQAAAAVRALKAMSIRTMLVTGDRQSVAAAVALELNVEDVVAELLAE